MKVTQHVIDPWYAEQELRIQECTDRARRLRSGLNRTFDPGHLYVVEFDSGVVKVGKARNVESRLSQHAKVGLVRSSWASAHHLHCGKTERQLIAFCADRGQLYGGREYFREVDLPAVISYAEMIVGDARRRQYLDLLAEVADGDLSVTWAEAHERLGDGTEIGEAAS